MKACTQHDIARYVGMDVSSVCKILNKRRGPVFRKETIKRVFAAAKALGYSLNRALAGHCRSALIELLEGGHIQGVSDKRIKELKRMAGVA
jgi:DNA-binding LacI/PurR family transcriptional regulator